MESLATTDTLGRDDAQRETSKYIIITSKYHYIQCMTLLCRVIH